VQGDDGAKFENLVALCLLKHVYAKTDYLGEDWALHYLRTKDGREVDFALVKDNKISNIIEAKLTDGEPTKALAWFQEKYNFPAIQIVKELRHEHQVRNIDIRRASKLLPELELR
jgi:predicted AAA+ superfamily ATPase